RGQADRGRPAHGELPGDCRRVPRGRRPRGGEDGRGAGARGGGAPRGPRAPGIAGPGRARARRSQPRRARPHGRRPRGAAGGTLLLAPLGALYGAGASARVAAYRRGWLAQERLGGPVISVGNISLGGSGKTPVVARLAAMIRDAGRPVAVLSRGYRGSFRG